MGHRQIRKGLTMYVYGLASLLDDVDRIQRIDRGGMLTRLESFPESCADALERANALDIPPQTVIAESGLFYKFSPGKNQ